MPALVRSFPMVSCAILVSMSGCGLIGLDLGDDGSISAAGAGDVTGAGDATDSPGMPGSAGGAGTVPGGAGGTGAGVLVGGADPGAGSSSAGGAVSMVGIASGGASSGGTESSGGVADGGTESSGGAGAASVIWDSPLVACPPGCVAPLLLYRPFEDALPAGIKVDAGSTVELGSAAIHSGSTSLVTTTGAAEADAQITETIALVAQGDIYSRAWMYVPDGAVTEWIKVLAFNNSALAGIDVNLLAAGSVEIYSQNAQLRVQSTPDLIPQGEWFCLGVHVFVVNDGSGAIEVTINGELVATLTQLDTRPGTGIDRIVYGIAETGSGQTPATIYTDDLVVSTEPVSCSPL